MESIRELERGFVDAEEKLNNAKEIIVFGASSGGKNVKAYLETYMKLRVRYFVDNDPEKWDKSIDDVPIISPSRLLSLYGTFANPLICIASDWAKDIAHQLREMGVKNYININYLGKIQDSSDHEKLPSHITELEKVCHFLADTESKEIFLSILEHRKSLDPICLRVSEYDQYCHPSIDFAGCKVLFDVGAWVGDTAIKFAKLIDQNGKIVAFEPTPHSMADLCKNIHDEGLANKVIPVAAGVSDRNGYAWIQLAQHSGSNCISSTGSLLVNITTIDDFCNEIKMVPNLIKMDIEGGEMAALRGAKNTIVKCGPGLQVCIYHRCEDLWEIPLFLKELRPDYKLYLGHHSQNLCETVIYAMR
jgi:FkbM family methyltransferase